MTLTTEMLAAFIGGQIEIQNAREGYIFRGEIKTAVVEDNELRVILNWMAKGEGFPPLPTGWVTEKNLGYEAGLVAYHVSDIGRGTEGGNRLCLQSAIVGEIVILFPPDGSKLDPARVKGLRFPTAIK